jgi:hypothetical protein
MTHDDKKLNACAMAGGQSSGVGTTQTPTSTLTLAGGEPYLRLLRDGTWVMGAEDTEIADGTKATINPLSIQHGYSCWTDRAPKDGENEKLGEQMWKITQPKADLDELPVKVDPRTQNLCAWKFRMSFEVKLMDGKYKDQHAIYAVTCVDGLRLVDNVMRELERKLGNGSTYIFPIVRIGGDSCQNGGFAKTSYVPIVEIVGWADIMGTVEASDKFTAAPPAFAVTGAQDASTGLRCI